MRNSASSLFNIATGNAADSYNTMQVQINGNYIIQGNSGQLAVVGNRAGFTLGSSTSSGIVTDNSWSYMFYLNMNSHYFYWSGKDLVFVDNNLAGAMFWLYGWNTWEPTITFTGLVYMENSNPAYTASLVTCTRTGATAGGGFNFYYNHLIVRGWSTPISISNCALGLIVGGYFEMTNRPFAINPAIYVNQGGRSIQLNGFYNITNNIATSNSISTLNSGAMYLRGMGGVVYGNAATGTGTQTLFTLLQTGSTLAFGTTAGVTSVPYPTTSSQWALLDSYIPVLPTIPTFMAANHIFSSNNATYVTTCNIGALTVLGALPLETMSP